MARKFFSFPWWSILGVLILGDLLMMGDVVPRAFAFLLTLIAVVYVAGAEHRNGIAFTIAHIPFAPALPVPGFDSLAMWRLVVIALVLRLLWEHREQLRQKPDFTKMRGALRPYDWIGLALLAWSTLSLIAAVDLVAGLRKIIFLANAALLYVALRWLLPRIPGAARAAGLGLATGLIGLLLFGVAQYIVITWASLFDFWQGWTLDVIPVFYGEALGQTLQVSNTWFAYYPPPVPPTLRMFSLLPDSHSFGVTMMLGFLLASAAIPLARCTKHRIATLLLATAFGIAVFTNGSRGIWIAAAPTAMLSFSVLYSALKTSKHTLASAGKMLFLAFMLLTLLFPVSSWVSAQAHGAGVDGAKDLDLAFRRAQSIFDLDEVSNRGRVGIWITNAQSVLQNPLFGVGIGNAAVVFNEDVSAARRGASAHNLYLDFAVETGILGGLLTLGWFLAVFLTESLHLLRQHYSLRQTLLGLCLVLLMVWVGIYNLVDIVFINDRALLYSLTLLAIVAAQKTQQRHVAVVHA